MKHDTVNKTKQRNFDVSPIKGSATRAFETAPSGGSAQKDRGNGQKVKLKTGSIPNR